MNERQHQKQANLHLGAVRLLLVPCCCSHSLKHITGVCKAIRWLVKVTTTWLFRYQELVAVNSKQIQEKNSI